MNWPLIERKSINLIILSKSTKINEWLINCWALGGGEKEIYRVFVFISFYSFSVIVAFATNYLLQQGVENATTTARYGVSDTQAFLRSTSEQSNHILVKNYDELDSHLKLMLMGT